MLFSQFCTFDTEDNHSLIHQLVSSFEQKKYRTNRIVDVTGRLIRSEKKGSILSELPPILERLHLDAEAWLIRTQSFERHYHQLFSRHAIRSKAA